MLKKNNNLEYGEEIAFEATGFLDDRSVEAARRLFATFFDQAPTPLVRLPSLAKKLGVRDLFVKDESARLGLGSFKAMGGAYAVFRVVQEEAERLLRGPVLNERLLEDDIRAIAARITVCCATDGNHGRSVAMGAKLIGCRAVIYLHEGVSEAREIAIQDLGAETVRVRGAYDESVACASREAAERGWTVVTDTSWPGNERIPGIVMQGYAVIAAEVAEQIECPTHIFLQAGVGGFAASIAGFYARRWPERRPCIVIVEPARAACLYQSNENALLSSIEPGPSTVMAMLECYEPSLLAWKILARVADHFMTVDEDDAVTAMRTLAFPTAGDPPIVSGESGGVGLAAFSVVSASNLRESVGLDHESRVLVFNTEGATDPHLYEEIVGRSAHQVKDAARSHAR